MRLLLSLRTFIVTTIFCCALLAADVCAAPADAANSFRIGLPFSVSGWAAQFGQGELNGAQLAADEINASGGVLNRPLQLIFEDTHSVQSDVVTTVKKLIDIDRVVAIVGPNFAEFSEVAAPVAQAKRVLMVSSSGYTDTLTLDRPYVFTMQPSHANGTRPLSQLIASRSHRKIGIITAQNRFFEEFSRIFQLQLAQTSKSEIQNFSVSPDERDFRTILSRLKAEKFDALVFFSGLNGEAGDLYRQLRVIRYSPAVYATEYVELDGVVQNDPKLAEGTIYAKYYTSANPEFIERYRTRFNIYPVFCAQRAYDAVKVVAAALATCNGEVKNIVRCVEQVRLHGSSGNIEFGPDHYLRGDHTVTQLWEVRGGAFRRFP